MSTLNLAIRQRQPELMDQPGIDELTHRHALLSIQRLNEICGVGRALRREIACVIREHGLKSVSVLDVACGGGDLAIGLSRLAVCNNVRISVAGCDVSRTAVAHANSQAVSANADNVVFFQRDVLKGLTNQTFAAEYDVVMCSLFLHHLEEHDAVRLLQQMAAAARHAVIVDDLRRTRLGYAFAWLGCRAFVRSPMVHVDGPLSVRGAFTMEEACSLAQQAGLGRVRIVKRWPQRFMLTWRKAAHV